MGIAGQAETELHTWFKPKIKRLEVDLKPICGPTTYIVNRRLQFNADLTVDRINNIHRSLPQMDEAYISNVGGEAGLSRSQS